MSSDDVGARDLSSPPRPVLRIDEARRRRLRPWAIAGVVCVALVTGSVALSYTSILGARTVEVEGEDHLAARRVMRLAGIEEGTNVFHLDTVAAERRLEAERWILDATVDTELPARLFEFEPLRVAVWFVGAAVVHDLVLYPLYSLGDRSTQEAASAVSRGPASPGMNYVRFPAFLSLLLLLVWLPEILRVVIDDFDLSTGLDGSIFLPRWLLITACLFAASAGVWGLRNLRRLLGRRRRVGRRSGAGHRHPPR